MNEIHRQAWVALPPAEIVAVVDRSAVPQIPYASLRTVVGRVRDDDGRLVDWELSASALAQPETANEYFAWRRMWRSSWPIGPVSNMGSLLRTADEIGHVLGDELRELLVALCEAEAGGATCAPELAAPLLDQLEALRLALVDTIEAGPGAGIVDETPGPRRQTGLSRAWVPDDVEMVLAASPTTAVLVRPGEGLVLLHDGPEFRSLPWLTQVDLLADPAVACDDEGTCVELSPEAARPLAWIVPRSLRWHVRSVPLVTVWTPLLTGLPDALEAAAGSRGPVRFTTRSGLR